MEYTEIRSRTHYSFLHGASSPAELIREAVRLGLRGLGITDLGGVYGLPKAYQAIRETPGASALALLSGAEIPILDEPLSSLTLLASDRASYGALCRLLTLSHQGRPKGTGGLTRTDFVRGLREVPGAGGLLLFPGWEEEWLCSRENPDFILKKWEGILSLPNSRWIPLVRSLDGLDRERTSFAHGFSSVARAPLVATQSALFHARSSRLIHDVLGSIHEGVPLAQMGVRLSRNSERHLKSAEEMTELFCDLPGAIAETMRIRDQCRFSLSELRYRYPSEWIPEGRTAQEHLEVLCREGLRTRYPKGAGDAVERQLRHELALIHELGFADYFLTVHDIVSFAVARRILCQGRGSAANSVVCYVLGITAIDPVRMNLLFERFLSTERGEPPDIDVDFEHERREEVIQYIYERYGRDRAAMVAAVVTYRRRSALRETARAFSLPVGTLSARKVERELLSAESISQKKLGKIAEVVDALEGVPRHLSIHSGGFTLSADPLDTIVPIEPATMEGRTIIQWDKYDLDILGLLKIDVLALGMLSLIRKGLEHAGYALHEVPPEDPKTYDMICKADTIGVFQIESRAQMSMLPRLRPRTFYDLVVELALVRPGPIVGNMVHPYLRRRRGQERVELPDPRLGPILGRTFGVPIFQEQVMKMAVTLAGFTAGEADQLRRAIGAWRSKGSIDEWGRRLAEGLRNAGIPDAFAATIFEQIKGFSEYGFPESHAASFALLTYVSSYLKCHHPAGFLCAILNSQPMGFYSPHTLVDDAKRHGVRVLPVSVRDSDWDCTLPDPNTVRLGFRYVRGVGEAALRGMIRERAARNFSGFQDLVSRAGLGFRSLRLLAMSGAFECMGLSSRDALFKVLSVQDGLFHREGPQRELFPETRLRTQNLEEKVVQDYSSLGLSARGHPMVFLREKLLQALRFRGRAANTTAKIKTLRHGSFVVLPGLSVILQRPPTAKGTAFATIEDEAGVLDLIFHKEVYERYRDVIREEPFLWVKGVLQRDGDASQVVVKGLEPIFSDLEVPIAPGAHALRY